jgi:hypothetical protein
MTIKLGDGWTLDSDERQWILGQEVTRKKETTGEEYADVKTIGYYRDLASVANAIGRKTAQRAVADGASLDDVIRVLAASTGVIAESLTAAGHAGLLAR